MIQSSQEDPIGDAQGVSINRAATGAFPRLKDKMIFEAFGERKIILNLMVLLYNFQLGTVGVNQILNSFMSRTKGFYLYDITETANGLFDNNNLNE